MGGVFVSMPTATRSSLFRVLLSTVVTEVLFVQTPTCHVLYCCCCYYCCSVLFLLRCVVVNKVRRHHIFCLEKSVSTASVFCFVLFYFSSFRAVELIQLCYAMFLVFLLSTVFFVPGVTSHHQKAGNGQHYHARACYHTSICSAFLSPLPLSFPPLPSPPGL